ncbi:hypothetical protein LPTSP3_g12890 [Leptospira kobayashii]|uniref:Lipoprotein n=1 Tax=Leptospira kobayashii TaxID=1917830 RepID=A0ABN6KF21_9LEPT|nr:hypothetical protein [Leptospira kobayashii]BDA78359.1 hypothetical protein LPTSP3_g12890 [Leptospira kobayashii]
MNRKLLILSFFFSCSGFQPADKLLVERALQNETDIGFISREFFQMKVEIPYSSLEAPKKTKREECKTKAFLKREELSMPFLLQVHRDKYRFGEGIEDYSKTRVGQMRALKQQKDAQASASPIPGLAVGNTNTALPNQTQNQNQAATVPLLSAPLPQGTKPYTQNFAWFFDSLHLYKEDYSDRSKCAFLFRNIQEKLYAKVEETQVPLGAFQNLEERDLE